MRARPAAGPIDFGDGSDAGVAAALWSYAGQQGLLADCSSASILSAFEVGFNVQFSPDERKFRQKLIYVLLDQLGCAFYDDYPIERVDSLVGLPILAARQLSFPVQIAVLDALYSVHRERLPCDATVTINGTHREKALRRTEAICDEVAFIRDRMGRKGRASVVSLIGVSKLQALTLVSRGFKIQAWDRDRDYVGAQIAPDVSVRYAADVDEQLSGADIALISGMTIGNNSLWDILRAAREHGVKTVCWAVTASNIAPFFRAAGLTSAVCEGFPPYFLPGETRLRIYRDHDAL
jgi:hypothetical protein